MDLQKVVSIVIYLIIAAGVFGLLLFLINYCERKFPGETTSLFANVGRVILVILAVLLLITILLSFAGVGPQFNWGGKPI